MNEIILTSGALRPSVFLVCVVFKWRLGRGKTRVVISYTYQFHCTSFLCLLPLQTLLWCSSEFGKHFPTKKLRRVYFRYLSFISYFTRFSDPRFCQRWKRWNKLLNFFDTIPRIYLHKTVSEGSVSFLILVGPSGLSLFSYFGL